MIFEAMQKKKHLKADTAWRDSLMSACILAGCSLIGFVFHSLGLSEANIISIYILGILFIASITSHWKYGAISSVVGVLLFNCLYADPIFNFYVYDMQYAITMVVMLIASLITNYIMTSFRHQLDREMALHSLNERIAREAEAERLRANLLRTISHDLRTPLTSISGNADILLSNEEKINPDLRKQLYQNIYNDSEWLINLVENLLFVTRIDNGAMSIHTESEVLQEIIPEALNCLARRAKEHNISLELPDELLAVEIDARLFMQVIINIVDNAIKYAPIRSDIKIRAFQRDSQAVVEVADTGCGISDEDKQKVFEMFYTTNKRSGDSRRGIGLGLPLCQSIVHAHGGTIHIADNDPSGVVVSVTLRLEEVCLENKYTGS